MVKQNPVDQIVDAALDVKVSIDAAIADATRVLLDDPLLREAAVKRMIAEIMMRKWEWDDPPLAQIVSDHHKRKTRVEERIQAGKRIDPTRFRWSIGYGNYFDPYGDNPYLPDDLRALSRQMYFVSAPDDDVWVLVDDLPDTVRDEIHEKIRTDQTLKESEESQWWRLVTTPL
jgi:hypothetical protein